MIPSIDRQAQSIGVPVQRSFGIGVSATALIGRDHAIWWLQDGEDGVTQRGVYHYLVVEIKRRLD